ncbi:hypothetical protein Bca101_070031 [Brassica carinata]
MNCKFLQIYEPIHVPSSFQQLNQINKSIPKLVKLHTGNAQTLYKYHINPYANREVPHITSTHTITSSRFTTTFALHGDGAEKQNPIFPSGVELIGNDVNKTNWPQMKDLKEVVSSTISKYTELNP